MAICSHLAPNGEKSILYDQLEQKYGPEKAHDYWEAVRSQQFLNKYGDWKQLDWQGRPRTTIPLDMNNEPTAEAVESRLRLVKGSLELRPGIFANPQQEEAVNSIEDFLNGESKQTGPLKDLYLLEGGAGVGKTTSINKALENFKGYIIGATVSDEARTILQQNMIGKKTMTLAKLLGLVADRTSKDLSFRRRNEFEEKKFRAQGKTDPIEDAQLIILDEASMVDVKSWKMLMDLKPEGTRIIFLGDRTQVPPIGEKVSKVFSELQGTHNYSKLTQVMRFQEGAPIFEVTERWYADNIRAEQEIGKLPEFNPMKGKTLEDKVENGEAVLYRSRSLKLIQDIAQEFKNATGAKDVVVIADKNDTVAQVNKAIRETLYDKDVEDFIPGERIRMAAPFVQGNQVIAENNIKGILKKKREGNVQGLGVNFMEIEFEKVNQQGELSKQMITVPVIKPEEKGALKIKLEQLAEDAKQNPRLWPAFFALKESFGEIDYAYAMTTHKVQGSTYKNVYVLETDIYREKNPREAVEINQMMRTATSRATTKLVIVTNKVTSTETTLYDKEIAATRKKPDEIKPKAPEPLKPVQKTEDSSPGTYTGEITKLEPNEVFVFGSNTEGRHGKGAALTAKSKFGAVYGQAEGLQGQSYGIITKDLTKKKHPSRTPDQIKDQIKKLYEFAGKNSDKRFLVAYKAEGSNLNAYSSKEMADFFSAFPVPSNIIFEQEFDKMVKEQPSSPGTVEREEIKVTSLEEKLPKTRMEEADMLARIQAIYTTAIANPDKIYTVPYEYVSARQTIGKTQYTARQLANLFDSLEIPQNVQFTPSMQALINNSAARIAREYQSGLPVSYIDRVEEEVNRVSAGMLIPRRSGFFTPGEQQEIQDWLVSATERLYRKYPGIGANAILKTFGLIKSKEQVLLRQGAEDKATVFTDIFEARVQLAAEVLNQLGALGLHIDADTSTRILDAVDQMREMTEEEKTQFQEANPDVDMEQVDEYTGEFLESTGRITRDWSENVFELDPKDTASARIKLFMGTMYEMDRGVYTIDKDGEQITEDLFNPGSMPGSKQLDLARRLSRKPFWYKDEKSSAALQEWLQANYPRFSKENFLGFARTTDYDRLFQETLNMLGDQLQGSTFDQAMTILDTSTNPTIQQMAELLRASDQSMKNEFMTVMNKQYQPFMMVLFNSTRINGRDSYTLNPIKSNRYSQRETLIDFWKEQQKLSEISVLDEYGNKVLDVKRIRERWLPILDKAVATLDWSKPEAKAWFIKHMGNILRVAGINVTDEVMEDIYNNPKKLGAPSVTGMFAINKAKQPAGFFSIFIMKSAGQLLSGEETNLNDALERARLNNPLYSENSGMQLLAKVVSRYIPVLYSTNHRNSEGKNVYDWGLNTKLSHRMRQFTKDFGTFMEQAQQTDIGKNNWLLDAVFNDLQILNGIELSYLDGTKPTWGKRGTTRQQMSDREQLLTSIALFQNGGFSKGKANYMSLTHSDKTMTPVFRNMPKLDTGRYGFIPNTIKGTTDSAMFKVFKAEYDRIVNQAGIDFGSKQYDKGKHLFYTIPDFNYDAMKLSVQEGFLTEAEFNQLWPAGQRQLTKVIDEKEMAVIDKILTRFINSLVLNTLNTWKTHGLVTDNKNLFDKQYVSKLMQVNGIKEAANVGRTVDEAATAYVNSDGATISDEEFNKIIAGTAAKDYAINHYLFNTALAHLFFGDPAETYKPTKNGNDTDHVNSTMAEYNKRLAKDIAPRADLYWGDNTTYKTITIADVKVVEDYLSGVAELRKAYVDSTTDSTDAQELTTVQEKLDVLFAAGKIPEQQYQEMSAIISEAGPGGYYKFDNPDHLKIILQPDKPLYAGTRVPKDGAMLTDYIKSSSFPLYPPFTKGREIDGLRQLMEKEGIARANYDSAKKIGGVAVPVQVLRPDGTFQSPSSEALQAATQMLDRSGFGIQQEVPYDEDKEAIKTITQMNEGITEGIMNLQGFSLPGTDRLLSGREIKTLKEQVRKDMLSHNLRDFKDKLNIDEQGNIDQQVVLDMLADEARKKGYTHNELLSVLVRDETGMPLVSTMFNTAADRFEGLLMSMVNKIATVKMPGKSYVQASSAGIRIAEESDLSDIVWVGDYDGSPLKGMRPGKDGGPSEPGQVILPFNFYDNEGNKLRIDDFLIERDGKKYIDHTRLPQELLQVIGARIPNQKHSSMHPLEVVGFVPENMGDIVFIPAALVKQMGGDFDVDKLYTYKRPYTYDPETKAFAAVSQYRERLGADDTEWQSLKTGTQERLKAAGMKPDDKGKYNSKLFNQFLAQEVEARYPDGNVPKHHLEVKEKSMEQLQKTYFDIHWSVLTHPGMITTVLKPLDKDDLKNESKKLKRTTAGSTSFFDPMVQLENFQSGKDAKRLVGSSSWAVKMNARLQDKHLQIGKMDEVIDVDGMATMEKVPDTIIVMDEHTGERRELTMLSGMGTSYYSEKDGDNDNKETRSKGDNHVMVQSESVDNAKNRVLDNLNLTPDTYKAVQALIELETTDGWATNSKYWTRLTTQPIIWEYSQLMKQGNDALSSEYNPALHQSVIQKLMTKYSAGLSAEQIQQSEQLVFDPQGLLTAHTDPVKQLAALALFNKLHGIGDRMFQLEALFNQDVSGAGPNMFTALDKERNLTNLNSLPILNEDQLYTGTEVGDTFDKLVGTALDVVGQVFPYRALSPMLSRLMALTGKGKLSIDQQKDFLRGFRSYTYSTNGHWWADAQAERVRLMYGPDSLANRLAQAQLGSGKDNPFLVRLKPKFADNQADANFIDYVASSKTSTVDKQNMSNGWLYLLMSSNDTERRLGEDLLRYAYLTGGVQDATSFVQFVPIAYIAGTEFSTMLKGQEHQLRDEPDYDNEGYLLQYLQHNPSMAPQINVSHFGKLDNGREFPESFEVPHRESSEFSAFNNLFMGGARLYPLVSYRPTTQTGHILYMYNAAGDREFYTRVDVLGNKFSDEYNGSTSNGHRSIFPENRSLAEQIPSLTMSGEAAIKDLNNNSFTISNRVTSNQYQEMGIRVGVGPETVTNALTAIIGNTRVPQYMRVVAEWLKVTREEYAGENAKKLMDSMRTPIRIDYRTDISAAGQAGFDNSIRLNPNLVNSPTDAAETFLHELTHNRLMYMVLATGFDERIATQLDPKNREVFERFVKTYRNSHPNVVKHMAALDRVRYDALNRFRKSFETEAEFLQIEREVNAGTITSDEHLLYYGMSSLQEFVAHVPTDKTLAGWLNMINSDRGTTLLSQVWELLSKLIEAMGEAFGMKVRDQSLLKESLAHIFKLTRLNDKIDITTSVLSPGTDARVPTESQAKSLKELLEGTYNRKVTLRNNGIDWSVLSLEKKKKATLGGQRGKIVERLTKQRDEISDALNRTHDLQQRTALRGKLLEVRNQIKQIHQSNDIATIAKVGEAQLKWVDEILGTEKPTVTNVSLALNTSLMWQSLVSILYGDLKGVDVKEEFFDIQNVAQKKRIALLNTKAVQMMSDEMKARDIASLTPLDYTDKLTDIDNISANVLALTRAKPLLVNAVATLGWREANNKDEHVYRNGQRLRKLEEKMKLAGLSPDKLLQKSADGTSWGLVNRLSNEWYTKINKDRNDLDEIIDAIDKSQNYDSMQRETKKRDAWNKYWNNLKKMAVFVDVRVLFDHDSGGRKSGPEVDKVLEELAAHVGNDADYVKELVDKAHKRYLEYISTRDAMIDHLDTIMQLTEEEKEGKSEDEQDELLAKLKVDAMAKWLQYNSPVNLLNKLTAGKNVDFNAEGDRWLELAPANAKSEYFDDRFSRINANPKMREAYEEYKEILQEMVSYLPIDIQRNLPENFFPVVPQDTVSWIGKVWSKIRNWDANMLQALTATDAEEASRLRPDKIPVMYTEPTSTTKDIGDRSTDLVRVLEVFSMMALQHRYMNNALDMINVAESIMAEVNRQRLAGESDGKPLRNVMDALKYFKDALVFRKPKELQGKVDSPIYSVNPAKQHKISKQIRELMTEKEKLTKQVTEKMMDGDMDTETEDKRLAELNTQLTKLEKMARNIYGSKVVDELISINQMKALGFNPFSAVSNYTFAEISLSIHARGGVDFGGKHLREAMGVMSHTMKKYWSFGAGKDAVADKVLGLMSRVGIMGDVVDTEYGQGIRGRKDHLGRVLDPFNWQRSGDYFTKGKLMVAMMKKQQIEITSPGTGEKKTIALWEAFDRNGEWDTEKYGPNADWDTKTGGQKFMQFRDRVRKVGIIVFGNQDKNSPLMAKKNWLWRLAGQFRLSWFPEGVASRFKPQYSDPALGRDIKGRWRSYSDIGFLTSGMILAKQMLGAVPGVKIDPFDGARDRKNNLISENPVDVENMRRNFAGLAWTVGFGATILILRGLGDDDEKKDNRRQMLINMLIRNQQDLLLYSSPAVFNTISGNFLPATQVIVDYWNAMKATAHYLFGDTEGEKHAFESWLKKMTRAGLPHPSATLYNKFETMMTRDLDKINR